MKKRTIHLISGTHWDREWRHTAEQSKLRLADLMDNIINILETKPQYKCFCVDGGTIVIEDYLTIRPENRERVKKLIEQKRMLIVNWYTLPEINTVAPEALIRNLLLGHKMANELGGGMKSGYTATSYGQPSQLPQLYRGFGMENAIFYRGTNKHILTPLFDWEAPDGSQIATLRTFDEVTRTNWFFYVHGPAVMGKGLKDLTYKYNPDELPTHMADMKSYEKAFTLLHEDFDYIHDNAVLKKSLDDLLKQAEPYAIGDNILALNMEDNDEPYKYLPELVEDMNKVYPDVEIIQEDMDSYMQTICDLPNYKRAKHVGELRYTTMEYDNFNALLGSTHSSRIKIKLYNDDCENNLINLAEPLSSYASIYGKQYPRTNIDRAWSALLKNHAHDSICGAAVDRAHEDMMYNFSLAKTVAEECTNRSVIALMSNIDSIKAFSKDCYSLTLFNTLPYEREEVVELVIDTPKVSTVVGDVGMGGGKTFDDFYDIIDEHGKKYEYVELSRDNISIGMERELDTKGIRFDAKRRHILVKVKVPQNGYTTLALKGRQPEYAYEPEIIEDRKLIARSNGTLENDYLKVVIHPNGTFSLIDKVTGKKMDNMHFFTDTGEVGDAHKSALPKTNAIYTSHGAVANITMIESNELRGSFKIELEMTLPAAATLDGHDRSRQMKTLPITTTITLEKDCKYLKLHTKLTNEIRDHKLTVHFPSCVAGANYADSESAWDVAHRTIRWRDHKDNAERFYAFQPMQNFVDVSNGKEGVAVLTKGLREYEVEDDQDRTIKITLLRTQRAYMTANGKMTVEELDKYTGQHSFGTLEYEYAIYPHQGNWQDADVLNVAYQYKVPIKAVQSVPHAGTLPTTGSFITIEPQKKVLISAIKQSEDGQGTILRVWNTTGEKLPLKISTILPIASVQRVRMDESVIEDIAIKNGKFGCELGAHKIETFMLKLKK